MKHSNIAIWIAATMLVQVTGYSYAQQNSTPTVSVGHSGPISSLAVSPDGKLLLSGSSDNTVKLWDIRSKRLLRTMSGHTQSINSIKFSPCGKKAASAAGHFGDDATVRIWDLVTGNELLQLKGHKSGVNCISFSPDGKILASGGGFNLTSIATGHDENWPYDGTVKLWEVETGKLLNSFVAHKYSVSCLEFTPSGKYILTGGTGRVGPWKDEHPIKMWDAKSGLLVRRFDGHTQRIQSLAISPDEKIMVTSQSTYAFENENCFIVWRLSDGHPIRKIREIDVDGHGLCKCHLHEEKNEIIIEPQDVEFSPDGKYLALGHHAGIFFVLNTDTYNLHQIYGGNKLIDGSPSGMKHVLRGNSLYSIVFTKDSEFVISGHDDSSIRMWNRKTGRLVDTFPTKAGKPSKPTLVYHRIINVPATGLDWCSSPIDDEMNWKQAIEWIETMNTKGGKGQGWRMPSAEELKALSRTGDEYPNMLGILGGNCLIWSNTARGTNVYRHNYYLPNRSEYVPKSKISCSRAVAVRKK